MNIGAAYNYLVYFYSIMPFSNTLELLFQNFLMT